MPRLLVVDDEPAVLQFFRRTFQNHENLDVLTAETAGEGLTLARKERPDVAVFDVRLPDYDGLSLLREVQQYDSRLPVIFITGGGTSATAIDAMRLGAFDYLTKPLDVRTVNELVMRALHVRTLMNEPVAIHSEDEDRGLPTPGFDGGEPLIGRSDAMQDVYKAIGRVAPRNVNVLIRGESGSGKELVARAIFQYSDRAEKPFLAVNCAAIPEALLESELFGHEKGAFTGADRKRIGKFEQCDGGTLFLDEIGDMPLALQSKMLRVLQDQRFERVGGNQTIATDVRIITATHRDLEKMSKEGRFRWDLYYRLNVYSIELPPLRDRLEDLPVLVQHFIRKANLELGKDVVSIDPAAMELLQQFQWPGNVRELQSVVRQAVLATTGPVVLVDFLPDLVRHGVHPPAPARDAHPPEPPASESGESESVTPDAARTSADAAGSCAGDFRSSIAGENSHPAGSERFGEAATDVRASPAGALSSFTDLWDYFVDERLQAGQATIFDDAIQMAERETITRALRHTGGNQVQAAKVLGTTRTTLRAKMKSLSITVGHTVEAESGN